MQGPITRRRRPDSSPARHVHRAESPMREPDWGRPKPSSRRLRRSAARPRLGAILHSEGACGIPDFENVHATLLLYDDTVRGAASPSPPYRAHPAGNVLIRFPSNSKGQPAGFRRVFYFVTTDLPKLDFAKADGLITAVVQDQTTGRVLMVGYMNEEAFRMTVETGFVTFYSRSRKKLWLKGESSGH